MDWKYEVSDFEEDNSMSDMGTEESDSSFDSSFFSVSLLLTPLSILGVYAFVAKGAVLAAMSALVGGGGVASALTAALWVVGAVSVSIIGVLGLLTVLNIFAALVKRSTANMVGAVLGICYFGVGTAGALKVFSSLPFLVGFMLTTTLASYLVVAGVVLVIGTLGTIFI